jgi:hypothetical protein
MPPRQRQCGPANPLACDPGGTRYFRGRSRGGLIGRRPHQGSHRYRRVIPSRLFLSCAIVAIVLLGLSISWWLSFFVIVVAGVVIALSKSNQTSRTR